MRSGISRRDERTRSRMRMTGLHSSREREQLELKSSPTINLLNRVLAKGIWSLFFRFKNTNETLISKTLKILLVLHIPTLNLILPSHPLLKMDHFSPLPLLLFDFPHELLSISRTGSFRTVTPTGKPIAGSPKIRYVLSFSSQNISIFCESLQERFPTEIMRMPHLSIFKRPLRRQSAPFGFIGVNNCLLNVQSIVLFVTYQGYSFEYFRFQLVFCILAIRTMPLVLIKPPFTFVLLGHDCHPQQRPLHTRQLTTPEPLLPQLKQRTPQLQRERLPSSLHRIKIENEIIVYSTQNTIIPNHRLL